MGVQTKAILWRLPLPLAQNWLYWNALIAAEQKDALCSSLSHGCALILYGVGIKTASVSSRPLLTVAEHRTSVSPYSWGSACVTVVCMK